MTIAPWESLQNAQSLQPDIAIGPDEDKKKRMQLADILKGGAVGAVLGGGGLDNIPAMKMLQKMF